MRIRHILLDYRKLPQTIGFQVDIFFGKPWGQPGSYRHGFYIKYGGGATSKSYPEVDAQVELSDLVEVFLNIVYIDGVPQPATVMPRFYLSDMPLPADIFVDFVDDAGKTYSVKLAADKTTVATTFAQMAPMEVSTEFPTTVLQGIAEVQKQMQQGLNIRQATEQAATKQKKEKTIWIVFGLIILILILILALGKK